MLVVGLDHFRKYRDENKKIFETTHHLVAVFTFNLVHLAVSSPVAIFLASGGTAVLLDAACDARLVCCPGPLRPACLGAGSAGALALGDAAGDGLFSALQRCEGDMENDPHLKWQEPR